MLSTNTNNDSCKYDNPLTSKYASLEMLYIFSPENKYKIWRRLWLSLAKAQKKSGLNINNSQIEEMEKNLNNIDFSLVKKFENESHHEVISHIKAFAAVCPLSAPIIHLGETSAFVLDNSDIIISKQALFLLIKKLYKLITILSKFCNDYKDLATLSFTHLQAAQPTTVGKRASLWLSSLILDFEEMLHVSGKLKLRGVKGATGTGASFKNFFSNYTSLQEVDNAVAKDFDFSASYDVTSQTYDRKIDILISSTLVQLATSGHKVTNDLRILQHFKEITEPFYSKQVGSSAMPYKRNPILSERIASLAKFIISLSSSTSLVASTQWLERTLDDSANKRLVLPQMFLAADSILALMIKVFSGLTVYPNVIKNNLNKELAFLLSENILMEHVKNGGNRQEGHEIIRQHAMNAFNEMQVNNGNNKLLDFIEKDNLLLIGKCELERFKEDTNITGFAKEQVENYLKNIVDTLLKKYNYLDKV